MPASLALSISTFPRKRIVVSPIAHLPSDQGTREGQLKTLTGWEPVALEPFAPGIVRIGQPRAFDNKSLLEGVLEVKDLVSGTIIKRQPRRIMVFRRVEMAGAYLEAEQVLLGEDVYIVARDDPRLVGKIVRVLEACARPGWDNLPPSFVDNPDGWRIFQRVQLFSHPGELIAPSDVDLKPLVPLTNNQLTVAGGFSLPGSVRGKWHREMLPEVRAVSDDPGGYELRLLHFAEGERDEDAPEVYTSWSSAGPGGLIADLSTLGLDDGNYRVELQPAVSPRPVSAVMVRVRSSDTWDRDQLDRFGPADQFLADPLSVVGASEPVGETAVSGAVVTAGRDLPSMAVEVAGEPFWKLERSRRVKSTLGIKTVPLDSCLYTGQHRTHVDTVPHDEKGRPTTSFVTGRCERCGIQRRYPSSHSRARKRSAWGRRRPVEQVVPPAVTVGRIRIEETSPQWDLLLDGVIHAAAGNRIAFERLSMFIEPGALMLDHVIRTLYSLGHIDVLRDRETFDLVEWEVAPSALVPTPLGYYLAGHWPKDLLENQMKASDLSLSIRTHPEAPTSRYFDRLPEDLLTGIQVGATAMTLAAQLPPLSHVIDALPRHDATVPDTGLTIFNPDTAKWEDTHGMGIIGGYRIRGFSTDDVLRTKDDIERGTLAGSTVHLSKHATAFLWGRAPLLAYDPGTRALSVPLGANLPGMYEKAVVLASGLAPNPSKGSLHYHLVSPDLAGHLAYLLSH